MRTPALFAFLLLGGCQIFEPLDSPFYSVESKPVVVDVRQPTLAELDELALWVETAHAAMQLSPAEALEEISGLETRDMSAYERFHYATLNQQLNDRAGWIRARDTLRDLAQDEDLLANLQQMAALLLQYNQAMINTEARRHQMALEIDKAQVAQRALEEKIQALTNLEQDLSHRKELATEALPELPTVPETEAETEAEAEAETEAEPEVEVEKALASPFPTAVNGD